MDTSLSSPQPEQAPQAPNPTSSKKKLSKKTLSFIGLLSIMFIVVGISIYVGYIQGQNQTATNQVSDNTTQDSEENTEEDNQTDTQSEGDESETEYPIVTDLEVSTISTFGESLNNYPVEQLDSEVLYYVKNNPEFQLLYNEILLSEVRANQRSVEQLGIETINVVPLVKIEDPSSGLTFQLFEEELYLLLPSKSARESTSDDDPKRKYVLYQYSIQENIFREYTALPWYTLFDGDINNISAIEVKMPYEQDKKEDVVSYGQVNLGNQTFTNFGPKEYQVTGYFEEIEEEAFDQLYTCEILNIQNASENFTSEVNESLENKNTLSVKNRGPDLQLDLNFQTNLDQSLIDQVKNSTPENPVTLTLNKRFIWADFGPGPCFSMYLVEDVQ